MTSMAKLTGLFRREFARRLAAEDWAHTVGSRPPMYGTLQVIASKGPISQREVADIILLHPSEMVSMIDGLEAHGMVRRERDPHDRRRYQLTLTGAGLELLGRFDVVARAAEDTVLAPLTAPERATLARLSAKATAQISLS